ncbi:MAG TPA: hypothetical protein VK488_15110 [Gaiellaceae bacterium]|nr:hypothetical protein [Gaiellaceae bacterium]
MPDKETPTLLLFDRDGDRLHATWSKSMRSLMLTVGLPDPSGGNWRQVSLDADQAAQLRDFITETHPD